MPKRTPFHECLAPLNETEIWKHWSAYLVAPRYQYSTTVEYYSLRNAVGLIDTSPLFKYRISGSEAVLFLERIMARNINLCKKGDAQYTCWCDPQGYVLQDGVVLRIDDNEFWLTSAEPTLHYFQKTATELGLSNLTIEDISDDYGILAIQGPHAFNVISQLTSEADELKYFECVQTQIDSCEVLISRTGFTGDLGYEIWVRAEDGVKVAQRLLEAGSGYNMIPVGMEALKMARVEAGLLLLDVDFHSSRFAWVDEQRETPLELGWRWMLRKLDEDHRPFIGREAIEKQINDKSNRWTTVGLSIDWYDYERIHHEAGIPTPRHDIYYESTHSIYRRSDIEWDYAGYATSFLYSSLLKKPIAIAKLPRDLAKAGTEVDLEVSVIKKPKNVLARIERMPFFNPARKIALPERSALA